MAPHSSTLAWKIPWVEEPGRLQCMGSLESDMTEQVHFHFSLSCIGEGNGNPLQCSCLENPRDGGAWWAAVYGVAQSRTRLKIPRPKDASEQKSFYSGKKKYHSIKNLLLINAALLILFLSDTYEGSVHDKRIADSTRYRLPRGSRLMQDLGFVGFGLDG